MKTISLLALVAVFFCAGGASPVRAQINAETVSFDLFYDSLEPYGDWISVDGYGYCWRPNAAMDDPEWRPYTVGNWVHTGGGWTWVSEEEFGWAVYHYGRWVQLEDLGWAWVPGYEWAPAWVAWRTTEDEQYVGWAPLPPEAEFDPQIGFNSWVDRYYDIGPSSYIFVTTVSFGDRRMCDVAVPWQRNVVLMTHSVNVTNIIYQPTVVNNFYIGGPVLENINRHCHHEIRSLRLERNEGIDFDRLRHHPQEFSSSLCHAVGGAFRVAVPSLVRHSEKNHTAPAHVKQHIDTPTVNRGWTNFKNPTLVDTLRDKIHGASAPPLPKVLPPKRAVAGGVTIGGTDVRRAITIQQPPTNNKQPTQTVVPPKGIKETEAERRIRMGQTVQRPVVDNDGLKRGPQKPPVVVDRPPGGPTVATPEDRAMRERAIREAMKNSQSGNKGFTVIPGTNRVVPNGPSSTDIAAQAAARAKQQMMEQQRFQADQRRQSDVVARARAALEAQRNAQRNAQPPQIPQNNRPSQFQVPTRPQVQQVPQVPQGNRPQFQVPTRPQVQKVPQVPQNNRPQFQPPPQVQQPMRPQVQQQPQGIRQPNAPQGQGPGPGPGRGRGRGDKDDDKRKNR